MNYSSRLVKFRKIISEVSLAADSDQLASVFVLAIGRDKGQFETVQSLFYQDLDQDAKARIIDLVEKLTAELTQRPPAPEDKPSKVIAMQKPKRALNTLAAKRPDKHDGR